MKDKLFTFLSLLLIFINIFIFNNASETALLFSFFCFAFTYNDKDDICIARIFSKKFCALLLILIINLNDTFKILNTNIYSYISNFLFIIFIIISLLFVYISYNKHINKF